ncbi:hypothetical protein [Bradyrhizobium sp. 45]|uniref:hypothetical protein n=1 Tax=Bradyrhizobium sp. 45 TaxID=1043587 RepID=UPI001FFA9BFF|nr:hypothetical protein [Bradyrhizobium sp. 45]MCK1307693.1 hypothetical protein [Bradyrhizobium sp. 45]
MSLVKVLYRIDAAKAGPFTSAVNDAQRLLPEGGRFTVNEAVMGAVGRMDKAGFTELLPLLSKAKLPFPVTWIEWPKPGGGGSIGYLCQEIETGGFAFRQYLHLRQMTGTSELPIMGTFGWVRVEPSGWSSGDAATARMGASTLERAATDILSLLLIINSPSQILEITDAADNLRIDAKRAKEGRPPLPNLRTIQFDIARFQRAVPDEASTKTQTDVAEHFVRGHFKRRKTGLFWWSPFVRYQLDEEPIAAPRDYTVVNSG